MVCTLYFLLTEIRTDDAYYPPPYCTASEELSAQSVVSKRKKKPRDRRINLNYGLGNSEVTVHTISQAKTVEAQKEEADTYPITAGNVTGADVEA